MTDTPNLPAIVQLREELAPMRAEFGAVLPSHITPEKFAQVCITAIENNPDLLRADRQSFKVACLNAANDGLLPDKREGAFVVFNTEVEVRREGRASVEKVKVPMVQWMPMITGILKKAYQTGKVQSISVELVYENDVYRRAAGDNAEIVHEPLDFGDRGKVRGGYAIIRMTDGGEPHREVTSLADIDKVRNVSRSKDRGPWVQFWEEMAKKTILRRALKRVPLSADVDRVLARDDAFYNLDAERRPALGVSEGGTVPRAALFDNRVHARRRPARDAQQDAPSPEPAPTLPAAEADATQDAAIETEHDQTALIALLEAVDTADSLVDLGIAKAEALKACQTDDDIAWLEERAGKRFADLGGHPPLRAIISSTSGVKDYEDAALWRSDILAKLAATTGDARKVFWLKNLDHLREAREAGFGADVDRINEVARNHGLPDA